MRDFFLSAFLGVTTASLAMREPIKRVEVQKMPQQKREAVFFELISYVGGTIVVDV